MYQIVHIITTVVIVLFLILNLVYLIKINNGLSEFNESVKSPITKWDEDIAKRFSNNPK